MMRKELIAHSVSLELSTTAETAFLFLANPEKVGHWSLGCWDTQSTDQGEIYSGTSLFDGETSYFRIDADPQRYLVDYYLDNPDSLKPRISIRVVEASTISKKEPCCIITINAWRDSQMDDARWHRLCATHEAEIHLLKALIEPRA